MYSQMRNRAIEDGRTDVEDEYTTKVENGKGKIKMNSNLSIFFFFFQLDFLLLSSASVSVSLSPSLSLKAFPSFGLGVERSNFFLF